MKGRMEEAYREKGDVRGRRIEVYKEEEAYKEDGGDVQGWMVV
jgi:hypothetical protein